MARPLGDQRVVITGASSGIGRATAQEFARQGAWVVLAARNEEALQETARLCEAAGGRARVVVTDVSDQAQVERLVREALEWGGRIDTWINNAAVSAYGMVEDLSLEEIERVIRVDLLGPIYGMKAVLPVMKRQEGGVIINVASVVAECSVPLQAPYCAAKAGLRGFTEALRMELEYEKSPVHVTLVLPASINTPFFRHARSRIGVEPSPLPPVYEPEVVAQAIVRAAQNPVRHVYVGGVAKMMSALEHAAPALMEGYMVQGGRAFRQQRSERPDGGEDTLFEPRRGPESVRGDYPGPTLRSSFFTSFFELHPNRKRLALAGLALAGVATLVAAGRALGRAGRETEWDEGDWLDRDEAIDSGTRPLSEEDREVSEMGIEGEPFFFW